MLRVNRKSRKVFYQIAGEADCNTGGNEMKSHRWLFSVDIRPGRRWGLETCRYVWGRDIVLGPLFIRLQRPT